MKSSIITIEVSGEQNLHNFTFFSCILNNLILSNNVIIRKTQNNHNIYIYIFPHIFEAYTNNFQLMSKCMINMSICYLHALH